MENCKIAENLIKLRLSAGITQAQLAEHLGVSNKVISKWENRLSMPDLNMLIDIAEFFEVSTDALLGISSDINIKDKIKAEILKNGNHSIISAFDISTSLVSIIVNACEGFVHEDDGLSFQQTFSKHRACVSNDKCYSLAVKSDNLNMSIMLLKNKNNFSWMNEPEVQLEIAELFDFLSEKSAISICRFIHSNECSESFTADFVSQNTSVSLGETESILEKSITFGLCTKVCAHMLKGDVTVYSSLGNGNILSLIALAYEHICRNKSYTTNFNYGCKLIGEK